MFVGFKHDIAGGSGKLIIPALQSPNFIHGSTGWSVNSDGSAEFHNISIPAGSGGAVITFASTAPASPHVGDIWYDTSNGLLEHQWNGSVWAPFQIGSGAISSGAITGSLLNASVTARSLGGVTTTISATAPSSPVQGDLWVNSTNGFQLEQYNGSAFVPISWNGADVISAGTITGATIAANTIAASNILANTITAAQIAANTITAGQIAAGTITGTQIAASVALSAPVITGGTINGAVFNGTNWIENSSGSFLYSGTPAANNLILAIVPATVANDGFGNNVPFAGTNIYDTTNKILNVISGTSISYYTYTTQAGPFVPTANIAYVPATGTLLLQALAADLVEVSPGLMLPGGPTPSSASGNAVLYANANGQLNVIDGLDQTSYATERRSLVFNTTQTSSTTFTTVSGLSSPVSSGRTYRFRAQICWVADQSAGQVAFRFNGPTTTAPTQASFDTGSLTSHWTPAPVGLASTSNPGLTMVAGQAYTTKIDGVITTTANGTFSIQIANVTAGDTFHIVPGTYLDLMPV
jgi:hypothetical protein